MRERLPLVVHLVVGEVVQQHNVALQSWEVVQRGQALGGLGRKHTAPRQDWRAGNGVSRHAEAVATCYILSGLPQLTCVAALASATTSFRTAGTFSITQVKAGT